ncbi:ShlB/FhaC/HecB family hemolysin secretion/activation protein [Variovorax sp. RHLX14]|uniref:ShlB/FhaC/HecB family hemolysin secretion/activation protein n=1 Tax=Variovorax sp. RHLX14 TaxID=1259731 RepID=UPI003F49AC2B
MRSRALSVVVSVALSGLLPLHAQTSSAPNPFIEEQRQQQRERALRTQQERSVDVRLPTATGTSETRLPPPETPCFAISHLALDGELSQDFAWSLEAASGTGGDDTPIGRCLGASGLDVVVARIQKTVIDRGYITTRVLASHQDLSAGTLTLTLIPGRIAAIRFADGAAPPTHLLNAIPTTSGDLLDLRDIEQGLENLKRLPTSDVDIKIEPSTAAGARPGDSNLVVKYSRKFPLRASVSLDDSGTEATGKTQTGMTLAWDGPLGLNDLAYVSLNRDAFNHGGQGTGGQTVHYSVLYGYWLFGVTASRSRYHQSVAGLVDTYVYAGATRNAEVRLSRLIHRDRSRKTTVAIRGFRTASRHFIDDSENDNQRRVVSGLEASLNHREFIGDSTLDGTPAYRRGTGAFGSLPAYEDIYGEGTSRMKLYTTDVSLNVPFALARQKLRYTALWRAQWNRTPLTPQDRFAIGGRYTVRGFDGETSLAGNRGWLLRNDFGVALGQSGAEFYAGIDYGEVGGPSAKFLLGRHLAGGVIGLRGAFIGLNYDLFVGTPIAKPEGYRTAKVTGGISLNYAF